MAREPVHQTQPLCTLRKHASGESSGHRRVPPYRPEPRSQSGVTLPEQGSPQCAHEPQHCGHAAGPGAALAAAAVTHSQECCPEPGLQGGLTRLVSCVSIMKLCTCFSALVSSNFLATTATTRAVQPAPCGVRACQSHRQAHPPPRSPRPWPSATVKQGTANTQGVPSTQGGRGQLPSPGTAGRGQSPP